MVTPGPNRLPGWLEALTRVTTPELSEVMGSFQNTLTWPEPRGMVWVMVSGQVTLGGVVSTRKDKENNKLIQFHLLDYPAQIFEMLKKMSYWSAPLKEMF